MTGRSEESGVLESPGRPSLHFTARSGWINDPVALTFHDGLYHLFFQHLPEQTVWGPACRWGHAVSADLLTWTERPVALEPGDGDGGCWSGNLVVDAAGRPTIFYTSVQLDSLDVGRVRTAHAADDAWDTWRKGPVVVAEPGPGTVYFRDPQVTGRPGAWRMVVGAGRADGTAAAPSYTSTDLETWVPVGDLAGRSSVEREPIWTGTVWECPQLVDFGDRQALLFAVWEPWVPHYEAYAVGTVVGDRLNVESWGRLSYGDAYYAGSTFTDAERRPGFIYWLRGVDDPDGGWAGAHSLPHRLELHDGVVVASPHPSIDSRRAAPVTLGPGPTTRTALPRAADLEWSLPTDGTGGLLIRADDDTVVLTLQVNGLVLTVETGGRCWPLPYAAELRLVLDGPVLEVFSARGVFATAIPATGVTVSVVGGGSCTMHRIDPAPAAP